MPEKKEIKLKASEVETALEDAEFPQELYDWIESTIENMRDSSDAPQSAEASIVIENDYEHDDEETETKE